MHAVLGLSAKRVAATAAVAAVVVLAGSSLPVQATPSTAKTGVLAKAPISPTHISARNQTSTGHPWAMYLATHGDGRLRRRERLSTGRVDRVALSPRTESDLRRRWIGDQLCE